MKKRLSDLYRNTKRLKVSCENLIHGCDGIFLGKLYWLGLSKRCWKIIKLRKGTEIYKTLQKCSMHSSYWCYLQYNEFKSGIWKDVYIHAFCTSPNRMLCIRNPNATGFTFIFWTDTRTRFNCIQKVFFFPKLFSNEKYMKHAILKCKSF